jgi:hypothetical protein
VAEGGFRRFLGLPAKPAERTLTLTELAAPAEDRPTTPLVPFAPLSRRAAREVRPPASPVSKGLNASSPAQKIPPAKKEPVHHRTPAYVWVSQATKDARSLASDFARTRF